MSYRGFGLEVSGSLSIGTGGAKASGTVSAGSQPASACAGDNWWKCASVVTYFTSTSGSGYPQLGTLKGGTWDKVQLAVINALSALGFLSQSYGWTNVKSQIRAMAWFLNQDRYSGKNLDFDDTISKLETSVAYAYDKAVADAQKVKDAAAAAPSVTLSSAYLAMLVPKKTVDTAAIAKALASVPPPKSAGAQIMLASGTMAPAPGMSTTTMVLAGVAVVAVAGGGYYLYSRKKKAA